MSSPETSPKPNGLTALDFGQLVVAIRRVNDELAQQAGRAVNIHLTLRNWMIGCHVETYERQGVDRADYGDKLMDRLADNLTRQGVSRCDRRELYRYRQFFLAYPHIVESLPPQFLDAQLVKMLPPLVAKETVESPPQFRTDGQTLLSRLSFTHIAELLNLDTPAQRAFYEAQCIQGNWSVRELKRQIHSLYFERCGLSLNPGKLIEIVQKESAQTPSALTVREPYVFEFLGLTPPEVMGESHLEEQLIQKIEAFLLELGHGFCFEARQKRILIGDTHYFVDLVFYHRILKCHVLVELKLAEFSHENIGQLNTYVSWYKKNMVLTGDNPPIGILLCTHKSAPLAEYALAGMDNQLFVSKYQLGLPKREEMERFLTNTLREAATD